MTISLISATFADGGGAGSTTIPVTVPSVAAGDAIVVFVCNDNGGGGSASGCADTPNGSYGTAVIAPVSDANAEDYACFVKLNAASGTNVVVTVTFSASSAGRLICACVVRGAALASAVDGTPIFRTQVNPGSGADAIVTGAVTVTNGGALGLAFCLDSDVTSVPSAGTGATSGGTGGTGLGATCAIVESQVLGSGSKTMTFTGSAGTHHYSSMFVVLDAAVTTGPTFSAQPAATQVASGATASFSVTAAASGGGALTYQWKLNGTNVSTGSGGTTASYTTAALGYADDLGSYTCAVTETGGTNDGTNTTGAAIVYVGTRVVGANTPIYSASAGTTVAPSYSTLPTIAAGDEIILVVAQKPSTANSGTVTTPSGYTLIGSLTGAGGYSTTLANNTGNTNLFVYSKTAAGSETGTFTVTVGTNGVCGAMLVLLRPLSGSTVAYALASGSDITAGNVSITAGSDPGETAGDVVLQIFGGSSQLILPFSTWALTTTGITYSSVSELVEFGTQTGNDVAGYIASAKAQSGTSSAAPVFTATVVGTNTNARGPGVVLRMRATAGGGTNTPKALSVTQTQMPSLSKGSGFLKTLTATIAQSLTRLRNVGKAASATQAQTTSSGPQVGSAVNLTATQTQAATRQRAVGAPKAATQTQTPTRLRLVAPSAKSAIVTQTPSLTKGQGFLKTLTATITQTMILVRALGLLRSVTQVQTLARSIAIARALAAVHAQSTAITRALARGMAVTQSQTVSLAKGAGHLVSLSASIAQTPSRSNNVGRVLLVTATQTLTRVRALARALSVTEAQSPTVQVVPSGGGPVNIPMALSATVTQTVAVARACSRALTALQTQVASRTRALALAAKTANQTQTPSVVKGFGFFKTLAATVTQSPALTKGRGYLLIFAATVTQSGTIGRAIGRTLRAVITAFASVTRTGQSTASIPGKATGTVTQTATAEGGVEPMASAAGNLEEL